MTQLVTFALLGQMLGPETAVDTPVNSPVTDDQYFTAAAWNGSEYLVVWRDGRLGVQWDIYGTRVTPSGQVLDVGGIPISTTATRSWRPDVAWDGQNFLVAWADDRLAALITQIYAKRVSSAGVVLDTTALNVSPGTADHPHVVSLNPGFLVVYQDERGADVDVYTARVTTAGGLLDPMGRAVSTAPGDQYEPALARRDGGYFVAWSDRRSGYDSVYAARLDATGAVLDVSGLPVSAHDAGSRAPDVSASTGDGLVVWQDARGGTQNIFAARISPAGVVRDPNGIALSTGANDKLGPRTAFDGTNFGVLWADTRRGPTDMYFGRVAPSGAPLDGNGLLIATDVGQPFANGPPSLTSAGNGFYASWTVDRGGFYNHDAFSALIGPTGAVTAGPFIVAAGDNVESSPAVAFDGTRHLAVWLDTRDNHDVPSVRSMRLGPSGAPLDAVATALPTLSRVASGPVIAGSDAGVFLVAWADNRTASNSVYAARVQASNGSADAMALALAPMAGTRSAPAVAFGGGNFVVVWQDSRSPGVYAARVTPQGTLLDPGGRPLSLADAGFTAPAIAFTGTQFVVAWERAADIQAVRVAPDLSTFDAVPFQVAAGATSQTRPAVGCGATQCLISWVEASTDIFAARLDVATGAVVDTTPLAVCTVAGAQSSVSTLALGSVYVVGWVDGRAGGNSDVYAARVPAVGPVLDPDGFSVSATPDRETALGLSSGLVVYSRGPTFDSFRVWARTLAISPSGTGGGSGGGSGGTGGGSSGTGGGSGGTGGGSGGSGAGGGGGGVEVMTTDGGWTAAVACGAPLELDTGWTTVSVLSGAPKGLTTKDGTVRWTPTSDEVGSHVLALTDGTQQATLNVVVTCEPRAYTVGCGCSHAEPWAAALLLVALARRRNRRAQRAARDNAPSAPRNASSATARRGSRS